MKNYLFFVWAKMDSNHRRRKPADLQSAPFGHSGMCPFALDSLALVGSFLNCDAKVRLFFESASVLRDFFSKKGCFLYFILEL